MTRGGLPGQPHHEVSSFEAIVSGLDDPELRAFRRYGALVATVVYLAFALLALRALGGGWPVIAGLSCTYLPGALWALARARRRMQDGYARALCTSST